MLRVQVLRKLPGTGPECDCVLVRVKHLCSTHVCACELCIAGLASPTWCSKVVLGLHVHAVCCHLLVYRTALQGG